MFFTLEYLLLTGLAFGASRAAVQVGLAITLRSSEIADMRHAHD